MSREELLVEAANYVENGHFAQELKKAVSYRTVSGTADGRVELHAYLSEVITPALRDLGCEITRFDDWANGANSFLLGTRFEDANLPTVLCYGHADVTPGQDDVWSCGGGPWDLSEDSDRWYGRGTSDNKGQHLINLSALRLLLEQRQSLGFNLKFLVECGEEVGSPSLGAFAEHFRRRLSADLFIGSDGPRLNSGTPTIFLGARGGATFELCVDLRASSFHSGNWGGLLRNPATTLAAAIGTLVDGHGRILMPGLLPPGMPASVRTALTRIRVDADNGDPTPDSGWGEPGLTAAERVYGWNTLEILAMGAADASEPVNAIPPSAKATLQLRFVVGTDVSDLERSLQAHLNSHGFPMVQARVGPIFPASRLDPDHPWVDWASRSIERTTGTTPAILPNIGGSLPNHVFAETLGLPTLWIPHSHAGCRQHAPDEHLLMATALQGLHVACGLFYDVARMEGKSPV